MASRLLFLPALIFKDDVRTMSTGRKRPVKDIKFNMRIDRKLKAAAEKAAAEDSRSLSSLIEKLLRDYLSQRKRP